MHVSEAAVDAVFAEGESFVVEPELVEDGGVDIVDLGGVFAVGGFVAPLVAFAVRDSAFDSAAGEPVGEDVRVVVAAFAALGRWHATEFGGPEDEGVVKHAALFEVLDQSGGSDGHAA